MGKNLKGNLITAQCLRELVIEGKRTYQMIPDAVRVKEDTGKNEIRYR